MGAYQGCGASQCCSSGRGRCMCGEDGPSESKVIGMSALTGEGCDAEMVEVVDMAPVDEEKRRLEMVVAIFIREALQGRHITLFRTTSSAFPRSCGCAIQIGTRSSSGPPASPSTCPWETSRRSTPSWTTALPCSPQQS